MIAELKNKISDHNQDLRIRPRRDTITAVSAHSKQALTLKMARTSRRGGNFTTRTRLETTKYLGVYEF